MMNDVIVRGCCALNSILYFYGDIAWLSISNYLRSCHAVMLVVLYNVYELSNILIL